MAAPLRFKPYIPKSQRPLKPKQTAPAPKTHEQDLTSLEACSNNLSSQYIMENFSLDYPDGMLSFFHSMDQCSSSNTDDEVAQDLAGDLSSPANQLALPVEPILHGDQNQDEEKRDRKADKMSPMLIHPTPPATTFGSTTGQQVADDVAEQTGFIESGAGTAMQSPDRSTHGIELCGVHRDASLSPPASSTSASAITILGSPSPEDRPGNDKGFQRQAIAIISKQTKRLLRDCQDDNDANNQAEVKRPRLSSTAGCGALLRQPGARNVASTPVDNVDVAYDESHHHLSSTRHNRDGNNGTCGEISLAVDAHARCPKHVIHSPMDQNGGPINPPTVQAGQCGSCLIFRSALLEALYLLQSPPSEGNTYPTQPESNILKRRYDLRRRPTASQGGWNEASNKDSLSCMDKQFSQIDDNSTSIDENDDSLSTNSESGNASGQRRRWSSLDECRLRAWKKENKSESWIASKLERTASAVKQQWRKMNQE